MSRYKKVVSRFCISLMFLHAVNAAKILALFHMASKSHYILGTEYLKSLAENGHNVTMVSPYNDNPIVTNGSYREIVLTGFKEYFDDLLKFSQERHYQVPSWFTKIYQLIFLGPEMSEKTLNHPEMHKLINSVEKFDALVLVQSQNDAFKQLGPHFGAHVIIFSTIGSNSFINPFIKNPSPSSYVPDIFVPYSSDMTLLQRLQNTVISTFVNIVTHLYVLPKHKRIANKYIPCKVPFYDSAYNISLVLLNSHEILHPPVPNVPVIRNIGGFHVAPPKKLPADLQEYLDTSKEGVILFSMGSNVKSKDLPLHIRQSLLKCFTKLKQNVLWKFENENLNEIPENVKIVKWLPQQDILAHPNVKLFITHGGLLSTIETVYHGVPIIAIPVYGDQMANAHIAEDAGYALTLPMGSITEESLTKLINEIFSNPKYRKNVQNLSRLLKDREVSPIQSAVYWTEYIIRHNGAKHLRVHGIHLPWYQYYLVDVIVIVIATSITWLYVTIKIIVIIKRRFFSTILKTKDERKIK